MDPAERKRGLELINKIKEGKVKDALKLIGQNAPLDVTLGAGEKAIHFAARYGLYDVVNAILKQRPKMAGEWNNNDQIPLHMAVTADRNQLETIIVLFAYDTCVDTRDKNENTPLDFAIKNKVKTAVELCCFKGASLDYLKNQAWEIEYDQTSNNPDEIKIIEILKMQKAIASGYTYKFIETQFKYVNEPKNFLVFESENITAKLLSCGKENNFFTMLRTFNPQYITKEQKQHINVTDEEVFGSLFELKTWKCKATEAYFEIEIKKNLKKSDELCIYPQEAGKILNYERKDDSVIVNICLKLRGEHPMVTFGFIADETEELFEVSGNKGLLVKPRVEPQSEIKIPPAAFDKPGKLSIKIADSKEAVQENQEKDVTNDSGLPVSEETPVLASSVLQVEMQNGQQPKKPIRIKLPIANMDSEETVMVVGSSKTNPDVNKPDDVEEMPALKDPSGKFASFEIQHFSFYVVVPLKKLEEKKSEIVEAALNSIYKIRQINFALCFNKPEEGRREMTLVIFCGNRKKISNLISKWKKEGYEMAGQMSETFKHPEGKEFQLELTGNVKEMGDSEEIILKFQGSAEDNFRVLQVCPSISEEEIKGKIRILEEKNNYEEITVSNIISKGLCTKAEVANETVRVNERIEKINVVDLPFQLSLPKLDTKTIQQLKEEEEELKRNAEEAAKKFAEIQKQVGANTNSLVFFKKSHEELIRKDQSIISPLAYISLYSLAIHLSLNEWKHFSSNLRLRQISEEGDVKYNAFLVLKDWRGNRPHFDQLRRLCIALESSNKKEYSDYIKKAHAAGITTNFDFIDENGTCTDPRLGFSGDATQNVDADGLSKNQNESELVVDNEDDKNITQQDEVTKADELNPESQALNEESTPEQETSE